jgi:hypothetical protein
VKITVTREFDSADEAIEFIGAIDASRYCLIHPDPVPADVVGDHVPETPAKKPRKPRADAGQARGPYRPRGSASAAPATEAKPEGAGVPSSSAPVPAPTEASGTPRPLATPRPAAPSVAAQPSAAPVKSSSTEASQATQAPVATELTEADVRATLGLLNSAPGGGMGACIKAIKDFGYERVSAMPKEKYAEFDVYIRSLLPK